jgi:hypothetical protein
MPNLVNKTLLSYGRRTERMKNAELNYHRIEACIVLKSVATINYKHTWMSIMTKESKKHITKPKMETMKQ